MLVTVEYTMLYWRAGLILTASEREREGDGVAHHPRFLPPYLR